MTEKTLATLLSTPTANATKGHAAKNKAGGEKDALAKDDNGQKFVSLMAEKGEKKLNQKQAKSMPDDEEEGIGRKPVIKGEKSVTKQLRLNLDAVSSETKSEDQPSLDTKSIKLDGVEKSGLSDRATETQISSLSKMLGLDKDGEPITTAVVAQETKTPAQTQVTLQPAKQSASEMPQNLVSKPSEAAKKDLVPNRVGSSMDEASGKDNPFKAYSVEVKQASVLDAVVPIVKKAVLNPMQKAVRDNFTVIRQETHFAPVSVTEAMDASLTQSVFKQVGDALTSELGKPSSTPTSSSSSQHYNPANLGSFRLHKGGEPLRVLDIQLHPADLGKVRLSIRLTDHAVEVRVEATNAATAKMLESNQPELDRLLQRAGYRADHISIVAIEDVARTQITSFSNSHDNLNQQANQGKGDFAGAEQDGHSEQGDDQPSRAQHDDAMASGYGSDGSDNEDIPNETASGSLPLNGITL